MKDLHTRLSRFGGPITAASDETITADVARGHRAVRRRRTVQVAAGSAFTVAALAAAATFGGGGVPSPSTPSAATSAAVLRLVDYHGEQPRYFTIDKVPEGYFVQNDDRGGLTIAPDSVKVRPSGIDPSKHPMYDPEMLSGKIGIYLEQKEYRGELAGDTVTVDGKPAVLHRIGATTQLIIAVSPLVYATIQVDVPLTRDQILELGAGLHVHQDAIDRMGRVRGK